MKKAAIAAAVAGVVVATAAALPWYVGRETEHGFRTYVAEQNARPANPFEYTVERYDRGWLGATAITRISARAGSGFAVRLRTDVRHGPNPSFGWAASHTVPEWDPEVRKALDALFSGAPAFTIDTAVAFDRTSTLAFSSPAFDKPLPTPVARIFWGGATLRAVFTPDEKVTFEGELPRITVSGMGYSMDLSSLKVDGRWTMQGPQVDWTGDSRLAIRQLDGHGGGAIVNLREFVAATTQTPQGDTLGIGMLFKAASFGLTSPELGQLSATDLVWDMELAGLAKSAIAKYLQDIGAVGELRPGDPERQAVYAQSFLAMARAVVAGKPTLRLKQAGFRSPTGDCSAQFTATVDGTGLPPTAGQAEWLERVSAKGSARFSRALLDLATRDQRYAAAATLLEDQGQDVNERSVKLVAAQIADDRVGQLVDSGVLKRDGDGFAVEAQWERGQLTLNGKPQ